MHRATISVTTPLTQTGCKLSPFGSYTDRDVCLQETSCAARWRCAKSVATVDGTTGEYDVFGVFFPLGSPIIADDGFYATADECMCYTCDVSSDALGCIATTDGANGTHADSSCDNACVYGYAADVQTGVCGLSLNALASREQCEIEEFAKNPGTGPHGGSYGCFDQFACRYGTCVGIPDSGLDGPRAGEVVYDSLDACESSGQCNESSVTVERTSVCIGNSCLFPDEFSCNPLPGVWQMWRVSGSTAFQVIPTYSSTLVENAQIHWKPPVVGAYRNWPNPNGATLTRIPSRPSKDAQLFTEFKEPGFAEIERVWYDTEEMYLAKVEKNLDGVIYPAGYELYPHMSLGFRRLTPDTVEVVLLPATYSNGNDNDTTNTDIPKVDPVTGIPQVEGRWQGWAVMYIFAPEDECFVMPSVDIEAEFPAVIPIRIAPMTVPDGSVYQASSCIFGSFDENGVCVCDSTAAGASCAYTCGGHNPPTLPSSLDADGYAVCQ